QNKYLMWDWNIDSMDWFYRDHRYVTNVIAQIEKRKKQKGPLVVLMHERRETLAQLPQLLNYLSSQHYECKALDSSMVPVHF
ncbi:MAG: polysaccharide deacetylase, partial [Bacillota bacterium]|nr:polysaccharide deacetylase [Bacillota bacterium]